MTSRARAGSFPAAHTAQKENRSGPRRESVAPVNEGRDLVWVDEGGLDTCTDGAGTGSHYPGREADLFWRGSEVVDLTGIEPVVDLTDPVIVEGERPAPDLRPSDRPSPDRRNPHRRAGRG